MKRYELAKGQWERVKKLLPAEKTGKRGRPRKNDRRVLNGMLWIVRSGAQWRELLETYGPWQSMYARFANWRGDGTLEAIFCALSAGNDHDSVHAVKLLGKVEISGSNVLADRAYGAKTVRAYILEQGASYVIPPQSKVSEPWPVDWWLYKERHLVECFFQKLKWFCRIATRYDKLDASFLAFVYIAAIAILLI